MQANNYDISVVIPYYNQPEQLKNALESLHSQENIRLEVFVVDDCSEKTCDTIIQLYKEKGLQCTLIKHETRQFTLQARLRGMNEASGKYLCFMDSDDTLTSPHAYAQIYEEIEEKQVDVLCYITRHIDEFGHISTWQKSKPFSNKKLEGENIFNTWLDTFCKAHVVWNKIYSQKLYKKVRECVHNTHIFRIEDFYLTAYFMFFATTYASSNTAVYLYNPPKHSGHFEKRAARAIDLKRIYFNMPKYFQKHGLQGKRLNQLYKILSSMTALEVGRMLIQVEEKMQLPQPISQEYLNKMLKYANIDEWNLAFLIASSSNTKKFNNLLK